MFKNLKLVNIGSNEFLAYNDTVAGIFSDYRTTSNSAIHQIENRKLTEAEIDQFLGEIDNLDDTEEQIPEEETENILGKIIKLCPEVKYIIHGIRTALAAGKRKQTPEERAEWAKQQKQERLKQQKSTKKKIKKSEKVKKDRGAEDEKKRYEQEEEQKRKWEEEKKEKEDKEESEKTEKEGGEKDKRKDSSPYTGFKGMLFNMYQNVFVDKMDPENKAEREALQSRLKRDWDMYQKNKKLFKDNDKLMQELSSAIENGTMSPETIALINEAAAKNPDALKNVDFSHDPKELQEVYLIDLVKLDEFKKVDAKETDKRKLEKSLKDAMNKEKVDIKKIVITDKKDVEHGRLIQFLANNWDSDWKLKNIISNAEIKAK